MTDRTIPDPVAEPTIAGRAAELPRYFDVTQLAEMTNICEESWRREIAARRIEFVKIRGSVRVSQSALDAYLTASTVPVGDPAEVPRTAPRGKRRPA